MGILVEDTIAIHSLLKNIVNEFQAPISFAMGYGSGVFKQSDEISSKVRKKIIIKDGKI
jgi:hypothetical protein